MVSSPSNQDSGIFQYDFGKTIQDQKFQAMGFLNQPRVVLRTAVSGLKAHYEIHGHRLDDAINILLNKMRRSVVETFFSRQDGYVRWNKIL